ncbi:MAG: hypothetical protein JSW38_06120 [Dehalococcoidia bacterium]|nr:MAG: hypothetical protein JSW38_06120 [Dehalococcoidia bacterium]
MTDEEKVVSEGRELQILVGFRALLGDSRAQKQMMNLQQTYASYAKEIMAEAQERYDALSTEEKENPERVLAGLAASTIKLRFKMLLKLLPHLIRGLLKSLNPFAPKD